MGGEALGSTAPLGEGGQEGRPAAALQVRASKSAPGETAPAAAGRTAAALPDTPARPQRDLLWALSEQLNRGGISPIKSLRLQAAPGTFRQHPFRAGG